MSPIKINTVMEANMITQVGQQKAAKCILFFQCLQFKVCLNFFTPPFKLLIKGQAMNCDFGFPTTTKCSLY